MYWFHYRFHTIFPSYACTYEYIEVCKLLCIFCAKYSMFVSLHKSWRRPTLMRENPTETIVKSMHCHLTIILWACLFVCLSIRSFWFFNSRKKICGVAIRRANIWVCRRKWKFHTTDRGVFHSERRYHIHHVVTAGPLAFYFTSDEITYKN